MFIRLTRLDNSPIWLNASFIVTVEPRRGGGTIVVPIGDGLDYEVREKAEAVLALLSDAPVPAVVPVPVSDCLTQTPDDVSPEPERSPEPDLTAKTGGRPFEKPAEKPVVAKPAESRSEKPAAKVAEEPVPAEVASVETPSAEPSAEPEKPARKTRKTATKKTTAAKPRKRTTKKAAAAEEDALAEPQPEPPAAESAKPLEDGDQSTNAEPSAAEASATEPPAVEAAPAKAAAAKPRRSARDFAKPEVSDFPLSDDQIERLRKMMPKSVRKLSNTLVAQFKVEEPEAAIKGLEDRGVLRLEFNHVVWA